MMNSLHKKLILSTILSFFLLPQVQAEEGFFSRIFDFKRYDGVAPVKDEIFIEECGACHFPYQPGLLPEASWRKLFDVKQMGNHFGDSAELDEETRVKLVEYALANSADKSSYERSQKIMASLGDNKAPLRITETPYIIEKHGAQIISFIKKNPEIGSLSQCDKCHRKAHLGFYDEDILLIQDSD